MIPGEDLFEAPTALRYVSDECDGTLRPAPSE